MRPNWICRSLVCVGLVNWLALAAFHSSLITRLAYDSAFADLMHAVLYRIRRIGVVRRALYGSIGPPAAEGRRS